VHVDLPDEADGPDRYRMAAATLRRLQDEGVLRTDPAPAYYVYRMTYADDDGRPRHTTGVLGALELSRPDEGRILPHEHTTPKARSDRLELLRATAHNLSPIWCLTTAPLTAELGVDGPPQAAATDGDGVRHELWVLDDPARIEALRSLLAPGPLVVADGHHRYETSLAYRDERRATDGAGGWDATLALVVELVEDELLVRPIHRLLSGLPAGVDLPTALGGHFDTEPTTVDHSLPARMAAAGALGLVLPDGHGHLLRPRPGAFAADVPDLDSARLAAALATLPPHQVAYQHGAATVVRLVAEDPAVSAGVLLRPATVAQIAATASGGERMPPKTTFFWPKPRTGFVYRALERLS
jgi:uncharacterized protein (DUF1015 family)